MHLAGATIRDDGKPIMDETQRIILLAQHGFRDFTDQLDSIVISLKDLEECRKACSNAQRKTIIGALRVGLKHYQKLLNLGDLAGILMVLCARERIFSAPIKLVHPRELCKNVFTYEQYYQEQGLLPPDAVVHSDCKTPRSNIVRSIGRITGAKKKKCKTVGIGNRLCTENKKDPLIELWNLQEAVRRVQKENGLTNFILV